MKERLIAQEAALAPMERRVLKPSLLVHSPGLWIEYQDENGRGFAQPDHLVLGASWLMLFECKLGRTAAAAEELETLYAPLVYELWPDRKIYLIEAFQHPNGFIGETVHGFAEIQERGTQEIVQWQAK